MPEIQSPPASKTNGPFIFASYSHAKEDRKRVYPHIKKLQQLGIAIWYDDALVLGEDWLKCVEENVSKPNCIGVIFYISENSIRSAAVKEEVSLVEEYLPQRFFAVNLLDRSIKGALDNAKDNCITMSDGSTFHRDIYRLYIRMFNGNNFSLGQSEVNKTYTIDRDDCLDRIVEHIISEWGYKPDAEFFPNCNVLHNGHIEYLPSLLALTPCSYTYLAASVFGKNIASTLNEFSKKHERIDGREWKEEQITTFTLENKEYPELAEDSKGIILIVSSKGELNYLSKALDKWNAMTFERQEGNSLALLMVFTGLTVADAAELLKKAIPYIIEWRKNNNIQYCDKLDGFILEQTSERSKRQMMNNSELRGFERPIRWRVLLSDGVYTEQIEQFINNNERWLVNCYLLQEPPFAGQSREYVDIRANLEGGDTPNKMKFIETDRLITNREQY